MSKHKLVAKQRGLTLLEIMIALTLGAFMLVGIISLMASVSATRTELNRSSELSENGRYAIQILTDEISLAGYFGPYFNASVDRTSPDPCEDGTTLANLGISLLDSDGDTLAPELPTAVEGFGYSASAATPSCFSTTDANIVTNGEVLVVRRVNANSVAQASAVDGDPYLQISSCDTDADAFRFGTVKANFTLNDDDCNTAQVWPYRVSSFFVSNCDECDPSDNIPTLKVAEYVDGEFEISSLVEGIQDIHFEYGIDLDNNGAPDCYVPDPRVDNLTTVGCPAAGSASDTENFSNVVSVAVSVLVRSVTSFPGWNDDKTYDLGEAARVGPFNDAFKRRVFRSVVLIQNVSGVRES
ncbi:type IV pilus assembly protein PilW [Litorivivens lipolytica]|uniref:Type IV pilus assembly protein PilW n=1 Tax=Litorivivens lipolytica TaxID=1524264 RepID=A0A7W4Z5T2_9GAMM|nr:PilW family protein [Litorivivens lipolytica]MBB3047508.1 type IV pilus assembly protein PilW [Litorivivens lipolytica]